jgi:hypothetical protein
MAARKKAKNTKDDKFAAWMQAMCDADPEFKASMHPRDLMEAGGVERFERDAVRKVREHWLEVCERWQGELDPNDLPGRRYAALDAKRLRRQLGIKQPPDRELIRAQTRERVRDYRERQRERRR